MADLPTPESFEQILSNMLSAYAGKLGINDFNVGSAVTSFFEVVALATARASGDVFQILRDFSVDRASGDALKRLAIENNVQPIVATPATGLIDIIDVSFVKKSTKVYAGLMPPNIGSTTINVSDASQFTSSGSIYIGRGTPNIEGPLPYSSITPTGGFFIINLVNPTAKFHNVGETVILAQGGNRSIPANIIVISPASGVTPDVQYSITTTAVILDGETEVDNIQVSATTPGTSGNVPIGAIKQFASSPFSGATVTNSLPFTTGSDSETDSELKVRIKRSIASTGLGTATAIKSAIIGATPADENATIVGASIRTDSSGATVYIDDGSGYEAKTAGVGLESIVDSALGGERFFQLATGGKQAPVAKAFLISTQQAPFDLTGGDTLSVTVGGITYQHVFATSDFRSPGGATAFEVTASINANTTLGFEATTSGGGTHVVVRAINEGNDSLKTDVPTTSGRDASVLLGFPSNTIETLRLYKNQTPLSKDGSTASIFSQSQQLWSGTITNGDTLILAVDGTAAITYSILDTDFIATGLYTSVTWSNTLASWAEVLNNKLTGVTVSVVGQQLEITSNLGTNSKAQISIDPNSTLVTKGMFNLLGGLTVKGATSDFTLSRNTAQFELSVPLVAGDNLTAGTKLTEGKIQSTQIPGGSITFTSPAHIWFLIDNPGVIIPTGVSGNTLINTLTPSANIVRYQSLVTSAFSNVSVGDYVIVWSPELDSSTQLEGRVFAVTSTTLDLLVTPSEWAAVVPQTGIVYQQGFVVLRSKDAPQKFKISTGTFTLDQIVTAFQAQTSSLVFNVKNEELLVINTRTKDLTGSLLSVTADVQGKLLNIPLNTFDVSKDSLIAFYDSQFTEGQTPLFIHTLFASGSSANPIDSYISNFVSSISLAAIDPNQLVSILHPYGSISDAQPFNETAQITSIATTNIGIAQRPDIRRLRSIDRFFLANSLDFGNADTMVSILDNNANSNFEIPLFRNALTNTGVISNPFNFNAYDSAAGSTTNFSSSFGTFDFSNFKVLMQAKKTLKPSPTKTALLYRANTWGRSGEKITVAYIYPSAANSSISSIVLLGNTIDITINLQSGNTVPSSIDATTKWNVTVTPNTPIAGTDQVTFTWSGTGTNPALTLLGGEYVNITNTTNFSAANTGSYRVSDLGGFTPTATQFSVAMPTGQGVVESATTGVVNGILFYSAQATKASDINTYVNANLSSYMTSTIVLDGDTSGSGVITKSTFEDSGFVYRNIRLQDGINWIASSNIASSPNFTFKNGLSLPTDVGYAFNSGETIVLVPTTMDQVNRFLNILAVTGFTTVGTIGIVDRGTRLEVATDTLGSSGALQVIGGSANQYLVPILDSAVRFNNIYMSVSVSNIAGQSIGSDQWFRLQATSTQTKQTGISSNTSVTTKSNFPSAGKSLITLLGQTLTQSYFGKPRHHVRSMGDTFRIEQQGSLVCLSWNGVGTSPHFLKSSLNFNDAGGGTINVYQIAGSSDTAYQILTGSANFNELSIGDLLTVSGLPTSANNGTFLVTGVSPDGSIVRVLNTSSKNEYSSGSFTFSGNLTPGDVFAFNGSNLIAGFTFAKGVSANATAVNLATAINSLPNVTTGVSSSTVTVTSTLPIPTVSAGYVGTGTVNTATQYSLPGIPNAGDVFTVNGTALVAGTNFALGTDAPTSATFLAAAINALSGVASTSTSNIVTVTSTSSAPVSISYKGAAGIIVTATYHLVTNSTVGDVLTIGAANLTAGVTFAVGGSQATTIANISTVVNGFSTVSSTVNGNVLNVFATSPGASIALAYVGSSVVTVSGSFLVGDTFVTGNFSASSDVREGDTLIISSPFAALNQGKFRVIRRYNDSVWFENGNAVQEEVTLPLNSISLSFDGTTSFNIDGSSHTINMTWNGVGTEPHLESALMGDVMTFGTDFVSVNRGSYMVLTSGAKLQQISSLTMAPGSAFTLSSPGKYFTFYNAGNATHYYGWFNVNGTNSDPAPVGLTGVQISILTGDNTTQIATKVAVAINAALPSFFAATPFGGTVTLTTVGFAPTNSSVNVNVPSPFSVQTVQVGRRTFVKCINPSAVTQSNVLITNVLTDHRPQLQFTDYEATVVGDNFVVSGNVLGNSNAGNYLVSQVIDSSNIVVTGVLAPVTNVSLNGNESAVFVQEGVAYTGYKQVYYAAATPGTLSRITLFLNTNNQYQKINGSAAVTMTSLNKFNFLTTIRTGLDSYTYNTGLIAEANRIIYGDPTDPSTYPGVGAAGAEIFVREPLSRRIQVSINVRINTGIPFAQIVDQVRSTVSSLINANPIGQPIAIGGIVSAVYAIPGVNSVAISSPLYDANDDIIFIAPSEKAIIIDPTTDISVSQIGT